MVDLLISLLLCSAFEIVDTDKFNILAKSLRVIFRFIPIGMGLKMFQLFLHSILD